MIKAELNYNPYLLETKIRFNGKEPRINSLVEKYQNFMLQTWMDRIPKIFYDEMNGYDFDLDFTGTRLDYEELMKALQKAGVTQEDIRLFYRNELDGRYIKVSEIDKLLSWLETHLNHKFDYSEFTSENEELFEHKYPYVVVNGNGLNTDCFKDTTIVVENVNDVKELESTKLSHIPILFYLDRYSLGSLQNNLRVLRERDDVYDNQIFFMIDGRMDESMVTRIIVDLGMAEPQNVQSINEDCILRYIEIYPVTDYIVNALRVFRKHITEISDILREENKESKIHNFEIHEQINSYERQIDLLQKSYNKFFMRDYLSIPSDWLDLKEDALGQISDWKSRMTKTTNTDEAPNLAADLQKTLQSAFDQFEQKLWGQFSEYWDSLEKKYLFWYLDGELDKEFDVEYQVEGGLISKTIPLMTERLLELKEENYVMPKEDIFGMFFKSSSSTEEKKPVLETTYYFQKWRDEISPVLDATATEIIQNYFDRVCRYEKQIAEQYLKHLKELIDDQTKQKEIVSLKLSDDEKKLQLDNDWIEEFETKVELIERG